MGYSKRQFVTKAFGEIGLASYAFDLSPAQLQDAVERLDSMMAAWNAKGIRLGYPLSSSPQEADLDAASGVPDSANEAIALNLGIRLAPGYGKIVSQDTKIMAKAAYDTLMSRAAMPHERQFPKMPAGAGNKRVTFLNTPVDPLLAGPDGQIDFE